MSFFGKILTFQVFHPNLSREISERVDVVVGDGVELEDISQYELDLPGIRVVNADIDIAAARIFYTIDESSGQFAITPGFNGYKFSDEYDMVAPIVGVTILSGPNAMTLDPDSVFFSENAIFVDVDGIRFTRGDTFELIVTFGTEDDPASTVPIDIQAVARLYAASFGRVPDDPGLNYWIGSLQDGTNLETISHSFLLSSEFAQRFGAPAGLSDEALIRILYENILSRPGEAAGVEYWVEQVSSGQVSRPNLLILFATSEENVAATGYVDDMARNVSGTEWIMA